MSVLAEGRVGETWARNWLKARGYEVFQPDWIASLPDGGGRFLVEVKYQERFLAPPFDGHGLPPWQVEARLRFERETDIPTMLLIRDKGTEEVFWQWLDLLENGQKFQTNGSSPRRVYPLESFELFA